MIKYSDSKIELQCDSPIGKLLGTKLINSDSQNTNNADTFLHEASGKRTIYWVVKQETEDSLILSSLEFFAGLPLNQN